MVIFVVGGGGVAGWAAGIVRVRGVAAVRTVYISVEMVAVATAVEAASTADLGATATDMGSNGHSSGGHIARSRIMHPIPIRGTGTETGIMGGGSSAFVVSFGIVGG